MKISKVQMSSALLAICAGLMGLVVTYILSRLISNYEKMLMESGESSISGAQSVLFVINSTDIIVYVIIFIVAIIGGIFLILNKVELGKWLVLASGLVCLVYSLLFGIFDLSKNLIIILLLISFGLTFVKQK